MSGTAPQKSSRERILDAGIFAPIGFLLNRDKTVADLAAAGRKQLAFSRSLGRAALKSIARGVRSGEPAAVPPSASTARTRATAPPVSEVANVAEVAETAAVDGYETMTARELIALITDCSDAQAAWIRDAEEAGKNRVTVVRALDRRQSP